jgi:predicted unusual protein kinase regulating ubiquinone biosynthesis (AarF/ABC1/UbiB family)
MKLLQNFYLLKRFFTGALLVWQIILGRAWIYLQGFGHDKIWMNQKLLQFYGAMAHKFRLTAVSLGGLLIKVGQLLSTRVDIFPQNVLDELSLLQDEVQAVPFDELRMVLEDDLKISVDEIFASLEQIPLASASLGQVHVGKLHTGEKVAVKIMRPGIEAIIHVDFRLVYLMMQLCRFLTNWYDLMDVNKVYREIHDTIERELDYVQEGESAEQMAVSFSKIRQIRFPKIYWQYTAKHVLIMEFMDGIKINDYSQIEAAGLVRTKVAQKVWDAYAKQVIEDGFFHADPHPGNLMVDTKGNIIFLDFGMMGRVSAKNRRLFIEFASAVMQADYSQIVHCLKKIGFLLAWADTETVAQALENFWEAMLADRKQASDHEMRAAAEQLRKLLYEQPFQIPSEYTFLGRAFGILYGICRGLDSEWNLLEQFKKSMLHLSEHEDTKAEIKEQAIRIVTSTAEIPTLAARSLRRWEEDGMLVRFPAQQIRENSKTVAKALHILSWSIVSAALFVAGSYLYVQGFLDQVEGALGGSVLVIGYMVILLKKG